MAFHPNASFRIHKLPFETYMSKLCVFFLIAPLPDKYRQLNPSSRSHLYSFSLMISVSSSSPHLSLRIPTYAPLSLGWSPTHQVPSRSFHDCVFDSTGRACAADAAISSAAIPTNSIF